MRRYHPLTQEERLILLERGTEPPFSGTYVEKQPPGVFVCKQCDLPLYLADGQFSSHCGWPSFDEALPGALHTLQDPDGVRTEIQCARCFGHLGHLFLGEKCTEKNRRFCTNSLSLRFLPAYTKTGYAKAVFAAGCFWRVQYLFDEISGVAYTEVGYTGGSVVEPSYEEVCSQKTGHKEAILLHFSPEILSFSQLVDAFFSLHDIEQKDGQGLDKGSSYQPAIYYFTKEQKIIANAARKKLEDAGYQPAAAIRPVSVIYPAEEKHQKYYAKKGGLY